MKNDKPPIPGAQCGHDAGEFLHPATLWMSSCSGGPRPLDRKQSADRRPTLGGLASKFLPLFSLALTLFVLGTASSSHAQGRSLLVAPPAYDPPSALFYAAEKTTAQAIEFQTPPVIDGQLNDPAWGLCKVYGDFALLGSSSPRKAASQKTSFRAGYDKERLYLAVRCEESSMDRLVVSAKPTPEKRDSLIEGQDVIHVLLSSHQERNIQFGQFSVNAAGEVADSLMNWNPAQVGWHNRSHDFKGVQVQTGRDATGWQVEMSFNFGTMGTWSADATALPWALQIVRFERPHGETSSWSPAVSFPHGPNHFGILFLGRPSPLYGERERLMRLGEDTYAVEAVVRKLASGTLNTVLTINRKPETSVSVSLVKPVSVVFLPLKIDRNKLTYDGGVMSKPFGYSLCSGSGQSSQPVMIARQSFRKAGGTHFSLPGLDDKSGASGTAQADDIRTLVPDAKVVFAGRRALDIRFDLPLPDDAFSKAMFTLRLRNATTARTVSEMNLTLAASSGVLGLDTSTLQPGAYVLALEAKEKSLSSCNSSCRFGVVGN
ncbi:MAG: hypothetical protein NTY01_18480 [Verrucomicrobia bacterium]|nr:hypothetical protein [Verrucomicrobiota bacterium]